MKNVAAPLKARWKDRLEKLHNMKNELIKKGLDKYKTLQDAESIIK